MFAILGAEVGKQQGNGLRGAVGSHFQCPGERGAGRNVAVASRLTGCLKRIRVKWPLWCPRQLLDCLGVSPGREMRQSKFFTAP